MNASTTRKLDRIRSEAAQMMALERRARQTVEEQTRCEELRTEADALHLVNALLALHRGHAERLEAHLDLMQGGGEPASLEGIPASSIFSEGKITRITVAEILATDYTLLNRLAIGYTQLHTVAQALDHCPTAELALTHLREITPRIMEISQAIPALAVRELEQTHTDVCQGACDAALHATQEAWRNETHFPALH